MDLANTPGFAPPKAILLITSGAVPVLDSVTVLGAVVTFNGELNASVPGETPAIGAMPVPLSVTVNVGFAGSLLEIVNTAVLAPVVVGVKVTLIVQFEPAARVAPQVVVCAKLPGFSPVSTILLMVNGAVPALIRVTV
jgi:hypothetical protein